MEKTQNQSASYKLMKQSFVDSMKKTLTNLSYDAEKTIADIEGSWVYRDGRDLDEEIIVPAEQMLKELGLEIPRYQIDLLKVILQVTSQWLEKMK